MLALTVTIGHATQLIQAGASTEDWDALTAALVAKHTPDQLANMLTGAATLLARVGGVHTP
jgi:hypothetical protein